MLILLTISKLLLLLVPILIVLGVAIVLWGVVLYFSGDGDEIEKKEGKQKILLGLVFLIFALVFYLVPLVIE